MGKGLDRFLNIMRLNDDNYDDDYDDDTYDSEYDEADDYDDYDGDEYEAPPRKKTTFKKPAPAPARTAAEREPVAAPVNDVPPKHTGRSKIVPLKQPNRVNTASAQGMEVSIQRPSNFDSCSAICDVLLSGKAAVINLEGIDVNVAQRIIDFISGSCYAMSGNIRKVSNYIFIVTPAGIDISGDIESALSSGANSVKVPAFHLNI